MKCIYVLMVSGLILSSCNEPRRGNDSNVNETRDEAAAEENSDKFAGKTERDAEFVYDVVASNYAEIKLAELASQKSRTPEVKEIAEKLLNDHAASLNELKTLAQAKAIAVPVEEKDDARRKLQDLSEESTEDFEKKWCDQMVGMHEKSIDNFEDRLEDTEDAELKAFLNKTLPVLKQHHEQLKACQEKLKNQDA